MCLSSRPSNSVIAICCSDLIQTQLHARHVTAIKMASIRYKFNFFVLPRIVLVIMVTDWGKLQVHNTGLNKAVLKR